MTGDFTGEEADAAMSAVGRLYSAVSLDQRDAMAPDFETALAFLSAAKQVAAKLPAPR